MVHELLRFVAFRAVWVLWTRWGGDVGVVLRSVLIISDERWV